jgi:hypothetical protein
MLSLVAPTIVSFDVPVKESASTLDNLQTAFNGESNANVRYLAFARKADEEGIGEVASLFAQPPRLRRSTPATTVT